MKQGISGIGCAGSLSMQKQGGTDATAYVDAVQVQRTGSHQEPFQTT